MNILFSRHHCHMCLLYKVGRIAPMKRGRTTRCVCVIEGGPFANLGASVGCLGN